MHSKIFVPVRWFVLSGVLVLVDQVSKAWAVTHLNLRETKALYFGLRLHLCYNSGIGFSLLAQYGHIITLVMGIILLFIVKQFYSHSAMQYSRFHFWGFTLLLGGGLSNWYDRITLGAVVDFISCHIFTWSAPIFNLADIFISLGALLVIWNHCINISLDQRKNY